MDSVSVFDLNTAVSHILSVNTCYFQGLIAIAVCLITLSVIKYFLDWDRVSKIVKEEIEKAKKEQNEYYASIMNKWIRSFIMRGIQKNEPNIILRLTHNAFAIETIKETYPNISEDDLVFYIKKIKEHVELDLDEASKLEKNDELKTIFFNIQNDLEVLAYKSKEKNAEKLFEEIRNFCITKGL